MAGDPGDRAPAPALAASPVQRPPALLLSGRSGRDGYLADRGRSEQSGEKRAALHPVPGGRQPGSESGPAPPRAQARHRRRQDHRDGHAHCLADHQCSAPAAEQPIHPRVPDRHPRPHHQGPAAGIAAERPRQLLPEPGARPERPAARAGPGEDRHHQLPRPPAPGARRDREGGQVTPPGPGARARYPGVRGPDAETGDARALGAEERPGAERRSPSLLPRETEARSSKGSSRETRRKKPRRTGKRRGCGSRASKRCGAGSERHG